MHKRNRLLLTVWVLLSVLLACNTRANAQVPNGVEKTQEQTQSRKPAVENQTVSEHKSAPEASLVETTDATKKVDEDDGLPLVVGGEEILRFKSTISGFTPAARVAAIKERISESIKAPDFDPTVIQLQDTGYSTDLVCGKSFLLTVTDIDAHLLGFDNRTKLAEDCKEKLSRALVAEKRARSPKVILVAIMQTTIAFAILLGCLAILGAIFPRVYGQIEKLRGTYIKAIKIQNAELVSEESVADVFVGTCRVFRGLLTLTIILLFIERVLSFFPTTQYFSTKVIEETVIPVATVAGTAIASYFPNLIIIALISASTYYLITFTHFIFNEISRGQITVSDFDPEWADPTYKIARFLIVTFALVLIFPYLPGSGSPAFQQISIFLGVLISLGSSGAVSNIVAGIFLTYTGAFRLGDRVKISDTVGDVVERKLLYTRVRTIKDEYITIPNSMVLGAHIINYSSSTRRSGLILHTSVTIGYDVPWQKIQKLLLAAAASTPGVLAEPAPFVLVTSLDDFYVTHEVNCYTSSPQMMAVIYGDLHKSILNKFAEAGVEIMSPHYTALRKGGQRAIPEFEPPEAATVATVVKPADAGQKD